MALLGTIVNALLIIIGVIVGSFLSKIPESMKDTVMKGIGLTVMVLGLSMGIKSNNFLIVIICIVFGAILGELMDLDGKLNTLGTWLEKKIGGNGTSNISQAFVTATLIFVIGAMAVIGALDSGIRGDHQVLYTKGMIDGFTAAILTTTLGIGVIFSSVPVFIYQGLIALFATQINKLVPEALLDSFIMELTAVGGIMIFAIGMNLIGILKIKVANLLPGLLITAIIVPILYFL
ncbi:DUF554 domain-containing protein [Caldibacillus lycopersici]|uniref:DUF554 domain-containing protein n=1 Tax=Perspicuibacillus lycopersici TaxID=1325689 RepID=A0AAE3IU45_9BACI|nr:DUF554 domain-containing protein [Perspicuibacillus lycopersici]MCU9613476.1 DUF554 domain-containing protein [Perspicuibacillus lycopersici]